MAFPGDKQQPGGWGAPQPPQSPYGPAEDQAAHGGSLFDRSYGSGPSRDAEPPNRYDGGPGSYGQAPPYGAEQVGGYGQEPPPYGQDAGGYGAGPGGAGEGPYGGGAGGYGPPGGPGGQSRYGEVPGAHGDDAAYFAPGDEERSGGGKKPLIIGAAAAAGIVVIGGGAALALSGGGGDDKPKPTAATSKAAVLPPKSPTANPTPTPTETGKGERLAGRATDPKPLTLNEVFKNKKFKAGGRTYLITTWRSDSKCANGVHGTTFRKALGRAGCTQVLRATFSNGKFVGTIGVLNLKTDSVARAAQQASRPKDAYVLPLPGAGTTSKIGKGLSLTTADPEGHYLIMSWVQYPNGKKIAQSDYSGVTAFVQNATIGSNLRPALNYRSMVGKPA
ncbi:hypothetical protein NE236_06305 [Actinoallomurus purpureus]|uniref:hypothetical protein n=1 Tax=Actinoallomurus purpureus TaxID=478114 RepID=UPI002093CABB|nr:hypothetical protein [Actinoallomurus purpureus]MCO6004587.1 hypothetical protein [Actinoallomurus purpureus]